MARMQAGRVLLSAGMADISAHPVLSTPLPNETVRAGSTVPLPGSSRSRTPPLRFSPKIVGSAVRPDVFLSVMFTIWVDRRQL